MLREYVSGATTWFGGMFKREEPVRASKFGGSYQVEYRLGIGYVWDQLG